MSSTTTPTPTVTTEQGTELKRGWAGQSIPRKEDRRLVQGQGLFFDDVRRHGTGYVHFVRSPYAHAKILSIDVTPALAVEGVYGTITGDEVAIQTDPFFEMSTPPGANVKDYALAVGKVWHMGEPVAAVAAGLHGIENQLDPGPAFEGNAYESDEVERIPATLVEAIDLFEHSSVALEAFGPEVHHHLLNTARQEWLAYNRAVTDWELMRGFERL